MRLISIKKLVFSSGTILGIVLGLLFQHAYATEKKLPNIVVFLSDDLGRWDTSIHGSPDAITPTMDRLAKEGMVFENAYVASPSCCPNRFSFLTGLMPARHGAHPNHSQVKPETKFLIPILKKMGYQVLSFGKVAHLSKSFEGLDFNSRERTDMTQHAKNYFKENTTHEPICLLVGDRRPHVSWTSESIYDPKKVILPNFLIDTQETREHWARYLSDITGMDEEMGRTYDLAKNMFGDNFIFLFSSDHGGQWPRGKWNLYDYGARIPLIVVAPGKIKPGQRTYAMVSWVDIIPTLIDYAGGTIPFDIDGRSFKPVLLGKTTQHRDHIFITHTGDGVMNIFPMRSIRTGQYKYIHNLRPDGYHTNHSDRDRKDGAGAYWDSWDQAATSSIEAKKIIDNYYTRVEFELFDIEKDPFELNNLAKNPEYANILKEMQIDLKQWTTQQGDELKPHKEIYPKSQPLPIIKSKSRKKKKAVHTKPLSQ